MNKRFNLSLLSVAVTLITGTAALHSPMLYAQDVENEAELASIERIKVTALGKVDGATRIVAPYNSLENDEVLARGGNLGDLLNGLPGVHIDSFGGGASRPVIRGQTSPRLKVLSDGSAVLDASDISPDHAITVDPLLAQRVEVLRGPATLLYGGGAIGGVVNILDDKIPTEMPLDGVQSTLALRGNTVADERAYAISLTSKATDNTAFHLERSDKESDNYESASKIQPIVYGSFSESTNTSAGFSWIGEDSFIGMSYSYRKDNYGLPGHSHEYEHCAPVGSTLQCGDGDDHDHDHGDGHNHVPIVDLSSRRVDLRGQFNNPFSGIERLRIRASHTDYQHQELDDGTVGTTFSNKGYEGRIEADHKEIWGLEGIVGVQFSDTRFSSVGTEAFIPVTDSTSQGVFAVERYQLSDTWLLEGGARYEQQRYKTVNDPRNRPDYDDSTFSWSGSSIWSLTSDTTLAVTYSKAQRLPHAQELYAAGVHLATNTYECGLLDASFTCGGAENDSGLRKETSHNIDISLQKHAGDLTYSVNLFRNDAKNYIYGRTLDQHENLRLIKYTQRDAVLKGVEAEVSYQINSMLSASLFGDYLKAELDGGENLPRVSPKRLGSRINLTVNSLDTSLEYYRVSQQNDIAEFESATPGYDMLNLSVNYSFPASKKYTVFVRASNLLDEEVWSHTSFLANVVPMSGRNISFGARIQF